MLKRLEQLHRDEEGAGSTEYVLLLVLVACVVIGMVKTLGATLDTKYEDAYNLVEKDVKISRRTN